MPPFNLMTANNPSRLWIDRAAESDADPPDGKLRDQRRRLGLDAAQNSNRPRRRLNVYARQRHRLRTITGADADLQLRAADFNSEKHEERGEGLGTRDEGRRRAMSRYDVVSNALILLRFRA